MHDLHTFAPAKEATPATDKAIESRQLLATTLSDVEVKKQRWTVQDQIPEGVITILAGVAGIAKSTILAWYVARLTNGQCEGDYQGQPVPVTIIAGEDDLGAQLVPRMKAAGANLDMITSIDRVKVTEKDESWITSPTLSDDLALIRAEIIRTGSKLLVIDPIVSLMRGDTHRLEDVRRNLDPLHQMASDLGIGIVCVAHFTKGAGRAGEKVSGSHAFRDIARSLLLLAVDEETDERILSVEKSNYSQIKPSFAFVVDSAEIPTGGGDIATVGCAQLVGPANINVQDLLDRDTSVLGDRSTELIEYVNKNHDGVTAEETADALMIDVAQARTYLSRFVGAGRIVRVKRGLYGPKHNTNITTPDPFTSVISVTNKEDITHITDIKPPVGVISSVISDPGYCPSCGLDYLPDGSCKKNCEVTS